MKSVRLAIGVVLAAGAAALVPGVPGGASAYPRPSNVVTRWQLEFKSNEFRIYVDPLDNKPYYYFSYTVANRTGNHQRWAPQFDLFTDDGRILHSGEDVPDRVTQDIIEILGNPLIETQTQIIGDLLQGDTNARDGVVVWPMVNSQVTELTLFLSGLSGESVRVKNALNGKDVVLRKTLRRDYITPGEPLARKTKPLELVNEEWIMR